MTNLIANSTAQTKQRIALWDNLKAFLIFTVVAGHFIDALRPEVAYYKQIFTFIYAFHMPLFIFISGLFHSNKNILKKCLFFVSAGYLSKVCITLARWLFFGKSFEFSLLSESRLPWFMFALAFYIAFFFFLREQNKTVILFVSIVVACFAGYDQTVGDRLIISRILIFLPFYTLGTMLDGEMILTLKRKMKFFAPVAGAAILLLWAGLCWYKFSFIGDLSHLFTGRNPFEKDILPYGPLYRLLCYAISFVTCAALIMLTPEKKLGFFTVIGQRTINIYFWHYVFICLLDRIFDFHTIIGTKPGRFGLVLMSIPVTLITALKIFDFPLKQLKTAIFGKAENKGTAT